MSRSVGTSSGARGPPGAFDGIRSPFVDRLILGKTTVGTVSSRSINTPIPGAIDERPGIRSCGDDTCQSSTARRTPGGMAGQRFAASMASSGVPMKFTCRQHSAISMVCASIFDGIGGSAGGSVGELFVGAGPLVTISESLANRAAASSVALSVETLGSASASAAMLDQPRSARLRRSFVEMPSLRPSPTIASSVTSRPSSMRPALGCSGANTDV